MVSTLGKAIITGLTCGTLGMGLGGVWAFEHGGAREPMKTMVRPPAMSSILAVGHGASSQNEAGGVDSEGRALGEPAEPSEDAEAAASGALPSDERALAIKRLVVTDRIEGREPANDPVFRADGSQIYAFVELSNPGDAAQKIEIVFEHESGKQVGFVSLPVPREKQRWRTWGMTEQIKESGRWVAKVRSEGGAELMSQEFVVGQG
jgi:hypothetical protein